MKEEKRSKFLQAFQRGSEEGYKTIKSQTQIETNV